MILMRVIRILLQQVKHVQVLRLTLMSDFLMVYSGRLFLLSVFFEMFFCYSLVVWPERYQVRIYAFNIAPVFSLYASSFLNYLNVNFFKNLRRDLWEMCKKEEKRWNSLLFMFWWPIDRRNVHAKGRCKSYKKIYEFIVIA